MSANKVAPMEEIEVEEEEVGVEAEPSKTEEPAAEKAKEKKGAEEPAEKKAPKKGEKREKKKKAPKKAKAEEKEEEEDKVVEEKIITINLRHAYLAYSRKQTPRSVKLVKKIAQKIFKTEEGVKIDESLNAILWSRGKTKSQRKVAIKLQKLESGIVWVLPAEA
jgi:large subunit ribosomal protein L31e